MTSLNPPAQSPKVNPLSTDRKDWRHYAATSFCLRANPKTGEGEILMLLHTKHGVWLPPGGHVEENEIPQEAAVRECEEETGIKVELVDALTGFHGNNRGTAKTNAARASAKRFADKRATMLPLPRWFAREILATEARDATGAIAKPGHEHLDFVFLARPLPDSQQNGKALDLHDHIRWMSRKDIEALTVEKDIFANTKTQALEALDEFQL